MTRSALRPSACHTAAAAATCLAGPRRQRPKGTRVHSDRRTPHRLEHNMVPPAALPRHHEEENESCPLNMSTLNDAADETNSSRESPSDDGMTSSQSYISYQKPKDNYGISNSEMPTSSRASSHASPPDARRTTAYLVLGTLFVGFCIGFSVGFWSSSSAYWQSNEGLERLGCQQTENSLNRPSTALYHNVDANLITTMNEHEDDEPWIQELIMYDGDGSEKGESAIAAMEESLVGGKSFLGDLVGANGDGGGNSIDLLRKSSPSSSSSSATDPTATARPNVYMNHIEAYELLLDDDKKSGGLLGSPASLGPFATHYFLYNSGIDVQVNQAYCAVASAAAVLNSLRFMHPRSEVGVDIPTDSTYAPYSYATQMDLFGPCTTKNVVSSAGATSFKGWGSDSVMSFPYGLSLEQMAGLLRCHLNATAGWSVTTQQLDDTHLTLSKMRYDMKNALADPSSRIIVNYHRAAAGQVGSGHFSPVGAYHPGTDSFLILDMARYKYPPVWMSAEVLYKSMRTYDSCGGWDFPHAQDKLDDRLKVARKDDEVKEAMEVLGCQKTLRGYIIATRS